jgi:hypothetical protein
MAITNGYATLAQVKSALRIVDAIDDSLIELAIEAASRQIDSVCERFFYSTAATRVYAPTDWQITEIDDLVTLTTLKTSSNVDGVFDVTWTATQYQLEPLNGIAGGIVTPFNRIRAIDDLYFPENFGEATVQVVGTFGFSAVPTEIKQAAVLLSSRIFKRNDSPLGVAGFGDLGAIRVSRVDPDIDAMLAPYKKQRFA